MSVILFGMDLADNEPYWWGWTIGGRGSASGHVDPDARQDFFDELKLQQVKIRDAIGDLTTRYAYDSATGVGWSAARSPATSVWTYSGDDTAMSLSVCCANKLTVPLCSDVTSTLAPEDFDGETWHVNTHWYQGGIDANPNLATGNQHSGDGYYSWHSAANPYAGYSFSGTWVAGTTYKVGFWFKIAEVAVPCTITLGYGTGTRTMGSDKVTLTVSSTELEWTYHELTWTPADTYVCDGIGTHDNVKLDFSFAPDSGGGISFDDGSVCAL